MEFFGLQYVGRNDPIGAINDMSADFVTANGSVRRKWSLVKKW